jgi:glycerophosphoryl diester phosphodiesterase
MAGLSLALGLIPGASAGQAGQEKLSLDVHAHRGGAGLAPENTLAAFRQALELGVDVLEMDLHVTRDGAVVVIHDATIDRTTNGRGAVSDHTLETLRGYDAGVKFAPQFAGERIPALRQVIELVQASGRATVRLNLETKFAKGREGKPSDFEERVLAILRETGFVDRTILQSFYHPSLAKMKGLEPRIKLAALLGRDEPRDPVGMMRQLHADYYSPNFQQATPAVIASLHQAGIPVVVWTVNETADAERLLDAGLGRLAGDGIITNFPDRILDLLRPRR